MQFSTHHNNIKGEVIQSSRLLNQKNFPIFLRDNAKNQVILFCIFSDFFQEKKIFIVMYIQDLQPNYDSLSFSSRFFCAFYISIHG